MSASAMHGPDASATSAHVLATSARVLLVAAHPDDETLGAATLLWERPDCHIMHITDGAPRDPRFVSPLHAGDRAAYARTRRQELARALRVAGVAPGRISGPCVVDQEAALHLAAVARQLAAFIGALRPALLVTHAYEGGHPDHDAVAVAAWAAVHLAARRGVPAPARYEMALYHGGGGAFAAGTFLPWPPRAVAAAADAGDRGDAAAGAADAGDRAELLRPLSAAERARKRAMLACFATQRQVIEPFLALTGERFRPAPPYDFTRPPHAGPLLYEQRRLPLSGRAFRALAAQATAELGLAQPARASAERP